MAYAIRNTYTHEQANAPPKHIHTHTHTHLHTYTYEMGFVILFVEIHFPDFDGRHMKILSNAFQYCLSHYHCLGYACMSEWVSECSAVKYEWMNEWSEWVTMEDRYTYTTIHIHTWGPPNPLNAVLEGALVLQTRPVTVTAPKLYTLSMWNSARSITAPERSASHHVCMCVWGIYVCMYEQIWVRTHHQYT